ncbi:hypothetical protein MRX96_040658 [Rhipicephalus microplus]
MCRKIKESFSISSLFSQPNYRIVKTPEDGSKEKSAPGISRASSRERQLNHRGVNCGKQRTIQVATREAAFLRPPALLFLAETSFLKKSRRHLRPLEPVARLAEAHKTPSKKGDVEVQCLPSSSPPFSVIDSRTTQERRMVCARAEHKQTKPSHPNGPSPFRDDSSMPGRIGAPAWRLSRVLDQLTGVETPRPPLTVSTEKTRYSSLPRSSEWTPCCTCYGERDRRVTEWEEE